MSASPDSILSQVNPFPDAQEKRLPHVRLSRYAHERGLLLATRSTGRLTKALFSEAVVADMDTVVAGYEDMGIFHAQAPDRRLLYDLQRQDLWRTYRHLMEWFFRKPTQWKAQHEHPSHQRGWTPDYCETARDHTHWVPDRIPERFRPALKGHDRGDYKERLFLPPNLDQLAKHSRYPTLNQGHFVPTDAECPPQWSPVTDAVREDMLITVQLTLEMYALAHGAPADIITRRMQGAPHMLAATGSHLRPPEGLTLEQMLGLVLFYFHYDFNLVTAHAPANCAALFAWLRDYTRFPVTGREGCYVLQAGRQLEYVTGGRVHYGMHEGIVTEATLVFARQLLASGLDPWRISTTLFACLASDRYMYPYGPWARPHTNGSYPRMAAGRYSAEEIAAIGI